MNERLKQLADAGVSIWLDDLSRERLSSGNLAGLINDYSVVGVTTNPTIFAAALQDSEDYAEQLRELANADTEVEDAEQSIMAADVAEACDLFAETSRATDGVDGRVSIEVDPTKARQTDATIAEAADLWQRVDRPNCFVKIPATQEGLAAITASIAKGICVNVTLIFSLERYEKVIEAYLSGLEQAADAGLDLTAIHSVASFFVSRVDAEVDSRLDEIGTPEAAELKGRAAIANARLAHDLFSRIHDNGGDHPLAERWQGLATKGARPQRPLWASTGVKNPDYADTMYITELVVAGTVNTMPQKTMDAFADHGEVHGDRVSGAARADEATAVMDALKAAGIDMADVVKVLEDEGVDKFVKSGEELKESIRTALEKAKD